MAYGPALEAALQVVDAFTRLHVDYLIGGSLASSIHGEPRSTNDVDFVADLRLAHVPLLVADLNEAFYISADQARLAVRRRSSFNIIYLKTMFKVDVFVLNDDPLAREEMRRRQRLTVGKDQREIEVASPEDTILQKMFWFRLGNEVSDRQWNDVLGVLKVQRDLDWDYLARWSSHLELEDLYEKARRDAERAPSTNLSEKSNP